MTHQPDTGLQDAQSRSQRTRGTTAAIDTPPPAAPARDPAIDVMRGLCIISMATAHLAAGSWPWHVAHAAIFVDGAVGFVMLSGLVVGITQRRAFDRAGLFAGERKLFRRTVLIYFAHIALCVFAFLVVTADPTRLDPAQPGPYVGIDTLGGPLPAAIATLTLQVNPHYTSILSLYVMLLLLAMTAVAALAHRLAPLVAAGSLALYGAGYWWPLAFTFPAQPGVPGAVNWATWQLLFVGALLVGWTWRSAPVRWALNSRIVWWCALALVATAAGIGWWTRIGTTSPWKAVAAQVFTEGTLAPATILMAFAAALVGYPICRALVRVAAPLTSPIARIGRHSLDCYLILSMAVILLPSLFSYDPAGLIGVGVTIDLLVVMFWWCLLRDRVRVHPWSSRGDLRKSVGG